MDDIIITVDVDPVDIVITVTTEGTGVEDHTELSNLEWTDSGHTGTANRLAAFGTDGGASEVDPSGYMSIYGNNSDIEYLNFDLAPETASNAPGRLWWNEAAKTLSLGLLDGGSYEFGQTLEDNYTFGGTGSPIEGRAVSLMVGTGNKKTVNYTDISDQTSAYGFIGLITAIEGGNNIRVTKAGDVNNINTNAYSEGDNIFIAAGGTGEWTNVRPSSAYYTVIVGAIANKHTTQGSLTVNRQIIPKLEDLSNVNYAQLLVSNLGLFYDTATGQWNAKSPKFYHGLESCGVPSFNNSTHILTIATNTTYWYKGTRVYLSTAITCDIDSFETLTSNTLYYFYFDDATGTLKCSDSQWNLKEHVPTFQVFWNGSEGAILVEKHNHTRDIDWHINAHTTIGTRYGSGLSKTYPDAANDALLQIESGSIWDEDQNLTISQQTTCRGVYKASASVYTFANYALPYVGTSGQPQYLDTDTYALTNVGASDFVVMWYYATNDYSRPIWIIPTHAATAYNTLVQARNESIPALSGLNLAPEMKLIYKVIYKGDGQFQEFVDYRNSSSLPAGGVPSSTAASVSFSPSGDLSSTTVQTALVELDSEKLSDAPSDGKTYGRKNATWSEVTGVTDHAALSTNLAWTTSGHTSGQTTQRIAAFGVTGATELVETQTSALYVGGYAKDYPDLITASNWTNNIAGSIAGTLGDRAIGTDELGSISEAFYTQYGWARDFIDCFITDATIIAALKTSSNWTKVTDILSYYNAAKGDRGQSYYESGVFYYCYGTSSHTWLKYGNLDTVTISDTAYIPKPQVEVGKGMGDYFTIAAKYDIVKIMVEAETTTAGNMTIGSTGTQEIASLAVTAACTVNGNAQVTLGGVTFNVALTTAQNTATLVATVLRNATYTDWTTGGTGTTVTFTSNKYKAQTDASYSDNGTGATGTMSTTQQGVDPNNDIVASVALPTVIGNKKQLTYIINADYPNSSARTMYININSAATVKLHIITQKLFE